MRAILEDVVPFQDFRIQRTDTYSSDEWEERRDIQEIGRQLKERKSESTDSYNSPDYAAPILVECRSSNSALVAPPLDPDQFDFCFYFSQDLNAIQEPWSEDRAFWPTVLTYGITFVSGIVGNALVIFALLADRKSHNATSSFLVSLAVADMTFLLICVPYDTMAKLSIFWAGGSALCKIAGLVEMLSASASVLNLTAVSVERQVNKTSIGPPPLSVCLCNNTRPESEFMMA
ncbi:hypothetical protein LSH36_702g01011 [Paralvinella palmiformis]|uniref:G-protein coupled receptors family 1 profile domain-containing protein n=1 Tax=Paralvinella palmiformis TaxID=53620 RepID=A0AAD9J351_9ANNE|nr:hypothetical protein LSH36_702g01011 [Paralvinella palmiformis]